MTWMTTSLTTDDYEEQINLETGQYRHRRREATLSPLEKRFPEAGFWRAGQAPPDQGSGQ